MNRVFSQKRFLIAGLILLVTGLAGAVARSSIIPVYSFLFGFFIILSLVIYKLWLIKKGKEKWGVYLCKFNFLVFNGLKI